MLKLVKPFDLDAKTNLHDCMTASIFKIFNPSLTIVNLIIYISFSDRFFSIPPYTNLGLKMKNKSRKLMSEENVLLCQVELRDIIKITS